MLLSPCEYLPRRRGRLVTTDRLATLGGEVTLHIVVMVVNDANKQKNKSFPFDLISSVETTRLL